MSDEDDLRELQERAKTSAPAPTAPSSSHVDAASLARMREGDEDESLDPAYRHVASCAVCRARLTDAEQGRALVDKAMPVAAPIPITRARKPPTRTLGWIMAAAAALGLVAVLFWRGPGKDPSLVVTQRAFVGTMGTASPTSTASAADRNVELTLESHAEAAVVIVCDGASGLRIHGAQPFSRDQRGKLVVVLAPRFFGPLATPDGEAKAWVFAGSEPSVQRVLQALASDQKLVEARVRTVADGEDVRLSIVTLAQ